jgi:hypothetical protein
MALGIAGAKKMPTPRACGLQAERPLLDTTLVFLYRFDRPSNSELISTFLSSRKRRE